MKDAIIMLMPAHAGAGAEGFGDAWNRGQRPQRQFKRSGQISGTVFLCQSEGLLFTQAELTGFCIVGDIAAGSLRSQPLAQVALIGAGLRGKFG